MSHEQSNIFLPSEKRRNIEDQWGIAQGEFQGNKPTTV